MTQTPVEQSDSTFLGEYRIFLNEIKERILSSQIKAAVAVNQELIKLYWEIGRSIHLKQEKEGWGAKTIEKLAKDLKSSFPDMKGFSPRNIQYMVTFAREYPDFSITQQLVAQIPWGHHTLLIDVVVELKAVAFDPRDAGQMNFYLSAADDILRSPQDNPSIGLLLCKDKKGLKVEYALRDIHKPIGVAEYEVKIVESLPEGLKGSLPTIEEIERELVH